MRDVERLHPSPADASSDDFVWLVDVDGLADVVTGGLRRDGISTASVNGGLQSIRAILSAYSDRMSPDQRSALEALAHALHRV